MRNLVIGILCLSAAVLGQQPYTGLFQKITNSRANAVQLWATTQKTLYRSDDQGRIFRPVVLQPVAATQPLIADVLVDGRDSNLILVATKSPEALLLRSRDAGQSWSSVGTGLPTDLAPGTNFTISILQTSEANPVIYVRLDRLIFKSIDQGDSFTQQAVLPTNGIFAVAPSDRRIMYAQTTAVTSSIAVSTDEGATWRSGGNLSPGTVNLGIVSSGPSIIVHPTNPSLLFGSFFVTYADPNATGGRSSGNAFYRSTDGGQSWNHVAGISGFTNGLTVSADGSLLLVSGQTNARSNDFGLTLGTIPTAGPFFINSSNPSRVFSNRGLLSVDGARTFAASSWTYFPMLAPIAPAQVRLETGTSVRLVTNPLTSEGEALRFSQPVMRVGASWLKASTSIFLTELAFEVSAKGLSPGEQEATIEVISPDLAVPLVQKVRMIVTEKVEPQLRYRFRLVAGTGRGPFGGDGGPAVRASFGEAIQDLAWQNGNLLVATASRLRRIDSFSTIQTIAGGMEGRNGAGDGGAALSARFGRIGALTVVNQDLYITDWLDNCVRLIDSNGNVQTFYRASSGTTPGTTFLSINSRIKSAPNGDLFLSFSSGIFRWDRERFVAALSNGTSLNMVDFVVNTQGEFRIAESGRILAARPRAAGTAGETPRVVAGNVSAAFGGDHGPASNAQFNNINSIAQDASGNLFILESRRLRVICPNGLVQTVAGNGDDVLSLVDGDIANSAGIGDVSCLTVDSQNRVYVGTSSGQVFALDRIAGVMPRVASGGVVSLAAGTRRIAPGAIFSIYGSELAGATEANRTTPLPGSIRGSQVLVNGVVAPLFFVSPGQINAQMPTGTAPGIARLIVNRDGAASSEQSVEIVAAQPDILIYGTNRAVAVNPNGGINSEAQGASPGEVIVVYLTGIGALDANVATGAVSPGSPLARVAAPASASIGGRPAGILFLGLAPGFVGLAQANLQLPEDASSGDQELVLRVGGVESNRTLIRVR